jgi:hypothetical protein
LPPNTRARQSSCSRRPNSITSHENSEPNAGTDSARCCVLVSRSGGSRLCVDRAQKIQAGIGSAWLAVNIPRVVDSFAFTLWTRPYQSCGGGSCSRCLVTLRMCSWMRDADVDSAPVSACQGAHLACNCVGVRFSIDSNSGGSTTRPQNVFDRQRRDRPRLPSRSERMSGRKRSAAVTCISRPRSEC